jgi:hypothetical protein
LSAGRYFFQTSGRSDVNEGIRKKSPARQTINASKALSLILFNMVYPFPGYGFGAFSITAPTKLLPTLILTFSAISIVMTASVMDVTLP